MTDHMTKDHPKSQTIWWKTTLTTDFWWHPGDRTPLFLYHFLRDEIRKSHSFPRLIRTSGGRLPSDPAGSATRFLLSEHSRNRRLTDHTALSGFVCSLILNVGCELVGKKTHCNYAVCHSLFDFGWGGGGGNFLDIAEMLLCIFITQSAISYTQSQVWKARTLCLSSHLSVDCAAFSMQCLWLLFGNLPIIFPWVGTCHQGPLLLHSSGGLALKSSVPLCSWLLPNTVSENTAVSGICTNENGAFSVRVQCCFTSTEAVQTIRGGEPRTATWTFTQLLSSESIQRKNENLLIV